MENPPFGVSVPGKSRHLQLPDEYSWKSCGFQLSRNLLFFKHMKVKK